jgi:hypothetical protein
LDMDIAMAMAMAMDRDIMKCLKSAKISSTKLGENFMTFSKAFLIN